ncbi:hypothetical protein ELY21_05895 [Legionella sp. km535]|uniref:hypothetical protein n=1 Tax=Legionella sp. km535 TaxID=2498107 RepID=UPI000F8DBB1A|nr:hypothetical protein [Legionella sp. km535]RUR19055.1 hypothetical protein ELY21_05895 [Legionella sp. km535]
MHHNKLSALFLALVSSTTIAGTMGPVMTSDRYLLLEAGASFTHGFYSSSAVFPETITPLFPNGIAINLNDFYPNNFWGGYIGASYYVPANWLFNARYEMYGKKDKVNPLNTGSISLAPVKLAFTVDKVFGDFHSFSYGVGAGAVIENTNDGDVFVTTSVNGASSESIQGRSRIDPQVEAFGMYRFANNLGIKLNAGYQIPVNSKFGNGDLNVSLGINYGFPV